MDTGIDKQSLDGDVKSFDKDVEAVLSNWKLCYLDSNQVDLFVVLILEKEDFELSNIEFKYCIDSFKHIILLILGQYFAKKLNVRKIRHNDKP